MEINTLVEQFIAQFEPNKRIYWLYIVSSLTIACIYLLIYQKEQRVNLSKKLWLHKSAVLDYKYFIVSFFIKTLLIVPFVLGVKEVTIFTYEYLLDTYGFVKVSTFSKTTVMIFYTLTLFIVSDFTRYWLHRFLHTVPFLWEFHKVHHSAKVLNPLTFYRVHPVENILFAFRYALSIGVVSGVFIYFFGAFIGVIEIVGVNILLFVFSLMGSNLRHSHIKIKYPKLVENFFISPFQHQIHHSTKHSNKNFGGYLAVWDKVFGTLEYSKNVQKIKFGIETKRFDSILSLLFLPLINIGRNMKKQLVLTGISVITLLGLSGCSNQLTKEEIEQKIKAEQSLGKQLFFDPILSLNQTQSCSTCHNPDHGFVDNNDNGVEGAGSLGDDGKSIGDRNTPSAAYAMFSPNFHFDKKEKHFKGGQFWDGREDHLKGQAGGPPLNPVEMNMPSKEEVAKRLENSSYKEQFVKIYGENTFKDSNKVYEKMTEAIASFETTKEFAPFDSKYDRYLKGEYDLTPLEDLGRSLFFSNNNTNCSSCHLLKTEDAPKETFSNYRYHNIGVPQNQELMAKNVVDPNTFIDHGLMQNPKVKTLPNAKEYDGKMKVPSLRNVAVTAPYMHNGAFQKLSTVVEFYDKYTNEKRTINPETGKPWANPEVVIGKEDLELLQKGRPLNERKVKALVAFMNLLTDKRYEHLIDKSE